VVHCKDLVWYGTVLCVVRTVVDERRDACHGRTATGSKLVMPSPVTLPAATIQDDFTTVLSEVHAGIIPSENIWLSCYKDGEPSVHGKISVSLHEKDRDRVELVAAGGVKLTRTSQVSILLGGKAFICPIRSFCSLIFVTTSSGTLPVV
jgi:hypothetical protein